MEPEQFTISLSGDPLDRLDALRKKPDAIIKLQNHPDAVFVIVRNDQILTDDQGMLVLVSAEILQQLNDDNPDILFLGVEHKSRRPWFAIAVEPGINDDLFDAMGRFLSLREGLALLPANDLAIAGRIISLANWHSLNRFCGCCGAPSQLAGGGEKRICNSCEAEHFPRVDPAVIMMVIDDNHCLLGRNASWPAGRYSTLAGFVEPGESLEEACRREVMEEAGIRVGKVSYAFSQPWPFPHSLMIGMVATALSSQITLEDELEDAHWFTREEVKLILAGKHPDVLPPFDHTASGLLLRNWAANDQGYVPV